MELFAELTSSKMFGYFTPFGQLIKGKTLEIDEFKMVRIEAKYRQKFCEIPLPDGVDMTFVVKEE